MVVGSGEQRVLPCDPGSSLVVSARMDIASCNRVHRLLTLQQVEWIVIGHQAFPHGLQRFREMLGSLGRLVQIELTFADHLGDVLMVHERVIARLLQLTVSMIGLAQHAVVGPHVAQQSHIVLIRIDIRFKISLTFECLHVDSCQLVIEIQCMLLLPHDVIGNRLIEDRPDRRQFSGTLKAVGHHQ